MKKNLPIGLSLLLALACAPQARAGKCADGQEADGLTRAGDNGACLWIQTVSVEPVAATTPLIVVLHGDNGGKMIGSSYPALARRFSERYASPAVFMLRPGYYGDGGKSDGVARVEDDDYSKANVLALAGALAQLRGVYPGRKLIVFGHSGGAAMAALLVALHPQLAEAAVLAGCPCDVQPWRQWRKESAGKRDGYWPNSLSPLDFARQVPRSALVTAVTGDKDENTLPKFAEEYVAALRANGVEGARFVSAAGSTHLNVSRSKEVIQAIGDLVAKLATTD